MKAPCILWMACCLGGCFVATATLESKPSGSQTPWRADKDAENPGQEAERPAKWARKVEKKGVPNLHRIDDALYRSAQPDKPGMKALQEMGIVTVVNLRSFHSDRDEIKGTSLAYEHIYMKAWHPEHKEAVRFLRIVTDPKRQPVLVHCKHGADRTGAMCALYRVAVQGWSKEEAIEEMMTGGYNFHTVWKNLPEWLRTLDAALASEAKTGRGVEKCICSGKLHRWFRASGSARISARF